MIRSALFRTPGLATALLTATLALAACTEPPPPAQGSAAYQRAQVMEQVSSTLCDTEAFLSWADSMVAEIQASEIPDTALAMVSQPDLNHGSAHDCQRLITPEVGQGAPMDSLPLVALFVSTQQVQAASFDPGRVVAEIVNYGPGPYRPLGIPEGLSCLWLESSGEEQWTADIRVPADGGCIHGDLQRGVATLEVHPLEIENPPRDYPSTGRWMWDDSAHQQFIGIRCGLRWCEIGATDFHGTESIATSEDVPGRWDEQFLARPVPGGPLTLSGLFGRIEPGADNQLAAAMTRAPDAWGGSPPSDTLWVATMFFRGNDTDTWSTYATKFSLSSDSMSIGHRVFLSTVDSPAGPVWRLRSRGGPWVAARRSQHTHSGAGTVRWAWNESDEGLWVPCDAGCCRSTSLKHP